jgi:hypothetical protein
MGIPSKQYTKIPHFVLRAFNIQLQLTLTGEGPKFSLNLRLSCTAINITLDLHIQEIKAPEAFSIGYSFVFKTRKPNHHYPCILNFLPT